MDVETPQTLYSGWYPSRLRMRGFGLLGRPLVLLMDDSLTLGQWLCRRKDSPANVRLNCMGS